MSRMSDKGLPAIFGREFATSSNHPLAVGVGLQAETFVLVGVHGFPVVFRRYVVDTGAEIYEL